MHVSVTNISDLWTTARFLLFTHGVRVDTRNGPAIAMQEPVTFTISDPCSKRVLTDPVRDMHPFFALFEALWVLEGRNDVGFLQQFVPRVADFSDDGVTWRGAYGHRLRHAFARDQIEQAVEALRKDPTTRQVVLGIWDPAVDGLGTVSKDHPCNDLIAFRARADGRLDMTVYNRSNDVVWGLCPGNYVVFTVLHQYIADRAGLRVGAYHHTTNDLHIYENVPKFEQYRRITPYTDQARAQAPSWPPFSLSHPAFEADRARLFDIWDDGQWSRDVIGPLGRVHEGFASPVFKQTIARMLDLWAAFRDSSPDIGTIVDETDPCEWLQYTVSWLDRRTKRA